MSDLVSKALIKKFNIVDYATTNASKASSFNKFSKWCDQDDENSLTYLKDHRKDLRQDIKMFYPEFQSAVVFLFDYATTRKYLMNTKTKFNIASYVLGFNGKDYHFELKAALTEILKDLKTNHQDLDGKISLDVHPVLERDLAYRAGLGWFGKNSMLIHPKKGSYFIIGSLLLNKELGQNVSARSIEVDHCGNCTACLDACPTQAIMPIKRTLDSKKCISTYTIEEFKDKKPPNGYTNSDYIFGCDICQDVCPWNKKYLLGVPLLSDIKIPTSIATLLSKSKESVIEFLSQFSKRGFQKTFKYTPLERTGRDGLLKNYTRRK